MSCVHVAQGEFEDTSSYTNRLEEMRKIGGDKWLSLLDADRTMLSIDSSADVSTVVSNLAIKCPEGFACPIGIVLLCHLYASMCVCLYYRMMW